MDIYQYISDEDIFNRYWYKVDLSIGVKYCNRLRSGDKTPGCYYRYYNNKLYFIDWASNKTYYTAIDIVMLLFNTDFKGAIKIIKHDFGLNFTVNSFRSEPINKIRSLPILPKTNIVKNKTIIETISQEFKKNDLDYWQQFIIKESTLNKYNVKSCKIALINKHLYHVYNMVDPMYSYEEQGLYKLYRPLQSKQYKWRSSFHKNLVEGYTQLPETGELLIITKSRKDLMVLYELGYNSIAVLSESNLISNNTYKLVTDRFKQVIGLFDNDRQGIEFSKLINEKYSIKTFNIDSKYNAKDISQFVKNNGEIEAKKFLINKINEL